MILYFNSRVKLGDPENIYCLLFALYVIYFNINFIALLCSSRCNTHTTYIEATMLL